MKFSPNGKYVLGSDELGFDATDWGWLDPSTAIGYRYGAGLDGLWTCRFPEKVFSFLGDVQSAKRLRFFAANGFWLVSLTDGNLDSTGETWPAASFAARGLGDHGERIFIERPDYDKLFIWGSTAIPVPGWLDYSVTMRSGILMWASAQGPRDLAGNLVGPPGSMQTFRDGWCCGYVVNRGLCLWRWGSTRGFVLSGDGRDFWPDLFVDGPDSIRVISSLTQGDTGRRDYHIIPSTSQETDLLAPPTAPPATVILPPVPPLGKKWEGPFFASGSNYGYFETPGNFEVLIRGDFAKMKRRRPVLVDKDSAVTVPDEFFIGVFMTAPGTAEGGDGRGQFDAALAVAKARKKKLAVYADTDFYPDSAVALCHEWSGCVPMVRGYPLGKNLGEPVKATPAQDAARIRGEVKKLQAAGFADVWLARTFYDQSGNYPDDHILTMQGLLTDIVLELGIGLDAWFAWKARDTVHWIPELEGYAHALEAAAETPKILEEGGPIPVPPTEEEDEVNIGQSGAFRPLGSSGPFVRATVAKHQDSGASGPLPGCFSLAAPAAGQFYTFNPVNGDSMGAKAMGQPGEDERVTFSGGSIMVSRPSNVPGTGNFAAFEWINL